MKEKDTNSFESFNLPAKLAEDIKERIADYKNNRNYYINLVVYQHLDGLGYDVDEPTSFNEREKKVNDKTKKKAKKGKSKYRTMSYKLPEKTIKALKDAAKNENRTMANLLKHLLKEDIKESLKEHLQTA